MRTLNKIFLTVFLSLCSVVGVNAVPAQAEELDYVKCPPVIEIESSIPPDKAKDSPVDAPIVISWDKAVLNYLTNGLRDLKPALDSINIAGGRYGMGTLLTTEWGLGGNVTWEDNKEVITAEAPLEPGTQYRIWTYLYLTLRNDKVIHCPRIGGEITFRTAGRPAEDGNPVGNVDLASLYSGDERGDGNIHGAVINIEQSLRLITVKDQTMGKVSFVAYKGIPLMWKGELVKLEKFKAGDVIEATFTGGRAVMVQVDQ